MSLRLPLSMVCVFMFVACGPESQTPTNGSGNTPVPKDTNSKSDAGATYRAVADAGTTILPDGGIGVCACNINSQCTQACACDPDCRYAVNCAAQQIDLTDAGTTEALNGLAFSANGGWAVGEQNTLLRYQNGVWANAELSADAPGHQLNDIALSDANNGWAVGRWVSGGLSSVVVGTVMQLKNNEWIFHQDSPGWELRAIDLVDANNGWAVGTLGQLAQISDGKVNVSIGGLTSLYGIDVVDMKTGWAVGNNGRIRKLAEGNWSTEESPTEDSLRDVVLTSATEGWAVGENGTILRLSAGKWTSITGVTNRTLHSIAVASNGTIWVVGDHLTVLRSGGAGFEQCSYGADTAPNLYSVATFGAEVWAVGEAAQRRRLQ